MTSQEEKVKATMEQAEKVGSELFRVAPQSALEISLLELTMMQLKVVLFLSLNTSAKMSVLAEHLDLGLSTATGIIDRLVKLDIVARENVSGDRRVVVCRLTEKGISMVNNAWNTVKVHLQELLMEVPEEKLPLIDEVLDLLLAAGRSAQQKALMKEAIQS